MSDQAWQTPYLERLEDLTGQLFRHIRSRLEAEGGPSPSQYFLLRLLEQRGVLAVSDLATRLEMTAAGATGLIDRLVKAGLVGRRRDDRDRSIVWVELSREGAARLMEARRLRRQVIAEIFAPLSPAELEQMVLVYQKVTDRMTKLEEGDWQCG